MVYLAFCFIGWTLIFSCLFWRSLSVVRQAVSHLKRLHRIPCDKCIYFTGDYRLKCTVNPLVAMTETAIDCRDFIHNESPSGCNGCLAVNHCSNANQKSNPSVFKPKFKPKHSHLK